MRTTRQRPEDPSGGEASRGVPESGRGVLRRLGDPSSRAGIEGRGKSVPLLRARSRPRAHAGETGAERGNAVSPYHDWTYLSHSPLFARAGVGRDDG
jgi:hypothetical protein